METLFFTIVAAVAVLSSILVITCKNPINSALSLIMTFFCLATFYVMLDARSWLPFRSSSTRVRSWSSSSSSSCSSMSGARWGNGLTMR